MKNATLSVEDIEKGMKLAILNENLTPVFCTSASKAVGFNNFLDFAVKYFPTPAERGGEEGIYKDSDKKVLVKPDKSGEPVMFVFKVLSEQHVGEMSLFKVYSGTVAAGLDLINQTNGKTERLKPVKYIERS